MCVCVCVYEGFPGSSADKESTCNAGDPSQIPELERSSGEGIGYLPQYSWASLVAQMVKNPPAMQETWVQSLGWEDPLEEDMATHCSILAWRIPWTEEPCGLWSMGSQGVGHGLATKHTTYINESIYNYGISCFFILLKIYLKKQNINS